MSKLNPAQVKAIFSDSKIQLILAGAGSGKTTVLTNKIAYLHREERVSCSNILALTFTRLAGKEMKERIISIIGEQEGQKLFCNTFHSFCVKVLREYGYLIGLDKNFSIFDEEDKESIIKNIIESLYLDTNMDKVLRCIEENLKREDNPQLADSILAAEEYKYNLNRNNAVDFNMLLRDTLRILKEYPEVREDYHRQYEYVFVDEMQDTNDIQMAIIEAINPEYLCVVGDDNQCIYEWRGAKPQLIIDFDKKYPGCEVIRLEENYRCPLSVVNASNHLISFNKNRTDKILRANKTGSKIDYIEFETQEEEVNEIIDRIKKGIKEGNSYKDYAILVRTNKQLDPFMKKLKENGVPYTLLGNRNDVLKKRDIRTILTFIDVAINNKNDAAIKRIINFPYKRVDSSLLEKMKLVAQKNEISLFEVIKKCAAKFNLQEFVEKIDKIAEISISNNALNTFVKSCEVLALEEIYHKQQRDSKIEDLKACENKIERWINIQTELGEEIYFHEFLKWIRIKDIQAKLMEEKDTVKLMTVHGSKGLEFNNVYISGVNEDIFPHSNGNIEEERRLFYVAITRTRQSLTLTRSKFIEHYGKTIECEPSRFLYEMSCLS